MKKTILILTATVLSLAQFSASAQDAPPAKKHRIKSFYASWGYNEEWYTNSTIHVSQTALGNYFDLLHAQAHDHMGWNEKGLIFNKAVTIPQYNYRLGFFVNDKQDLAIELNFDHTKYIIADQQSIRLRGTLNGKATDSMIVFSQANGDYYFLNNGANFFLFNLVKRKALYQSKHNNLRYDFLGKIGIGPVIPHVQNSFFGNANDPHFQLGGWNTGIETAVRATFYKYCYLEFSQKVDYARYSGLQISDGGIVRQHFGTYELILSFGLTFPTGHKNALFTTTNPQ